MGKVNYLSNHITVKTLAAGLRRGGLLPADYFKDRNFSEKFIKSAIAMGFHPEEAACQVKTDQTFVENKLAKNKNITSESV